MSNTAPVLKEQASEQSHNTSSATSSTVPSRFIGLAAIIPFTTSGPRFRIMSVSIGPGATQFTRISVSANSRPRALVNAITPALAARVDRQVPHSLLARKRPHVDDPAFTHLSHERDCAVANIEHADKIYADGALPFDRRHVLKGLSAREVSGVVDENVDPRVLADDAPSCGCDLLRVCNIHLDRGYPLQGSWSGVPRPN